MTNEEIRLRDAETAVRTMLAAAGLPASEAEIAALTVSYPMLRAGVEELYAAPEVRYLDPALRFRAAVDTPAAAWAEPPPSRNS